MHTHAHVKDVNKHDTHEGSHLQFLYMYVTGPPGALLFDRDQRLH